MDAQTDLADRISRHDWFHTIDFGDGIVTKGHCAADVLRAKSDCYFSTSPVRKSVLDIGCWDGYFSLEALRRGASRVLATDHHVWHGAWGRGAFDLVREHLAPDLEVKDIDVYDISPEMVGTFDIVLFTGVFYHVRHPLLALERAASACTGTLVVETVLDAMDVVRPAMVFYPGSELKNDPSSWWGPNRPCVEAMLRDLGFKHIRFTPTPIPRKWTLLDRFKQNPVITPAWRLSRQPLTHRIVAPPCSALVHSSSKRTAFDLNQCTLAALPLTIELRLQMESKHGSVAGSPIGRGLGHFAGHGRRTA